MNLGKILKKAAKVAAPVVGGIFGGPAGAAIGSGIAGLFGSEEAAKAGSAAAGIADPFASQRPMYQSILGRLYGGMAPGYGGGGGGGFAPSGLAAAGKRYFKGSHPVGGGEDYGGTSHILSGGLGGGMLAGGGLFGLAKGLGGLIKGTGTRMTGSIAANSGNPMMDFMRNNPAYQFTLGETMRGTERAAAARGMNYSGNLMTALQDRASGLASQTYNTEVDRIMRMAGVGAGSPGAAGELSYQGQRASQGAFNQGLGAIGYGLSGMFSGGGGTPSFPSTAEDYYTSDVGFDWGD